MLTALVVDPSATARRRVGVLLRLGGWHVVEAQTAEQALLVAATRDLDLVVTEITLPGETGLSLMARLRSNGCRARLLVVAKNPTQRIRAAAARAGALGCLAKPLDPWALIDFLSRRAAQPTRHLRVVREVEDLHEDDVDADTMDRLREMFVSALPHRLSLIADGARSGDPMAVAAAAQTLAGASGQLGHPSIAMLCQEIAAEARRGVVSQTRLTELQEYCLKATRTSRPVEATVLTGS